MNAKRRPSIEEASDHKEFADWYWLKSELVDFCRQAGLKTSGSKADLTQRICDFKTGSVRKNVDAERSGKKPVDFDWHRGKITQRTAITPSYKNTQNVRAFFKMTIGDRFKFNIEFMDWMRTNSGKTMGDAIEHWFHIEEERKQGVRSAIPASNQFNRFVRDFFDAEANATMDQARALWKQARNQPGSNRYADTIGKTKPENDRPIKR